MPHLIWPSCKAAGVADKPAAARGMRQAAQALPPAARCPLQLSESGSLEHAQQDAARAGHVTLLCSQTLGISEGTTRPTVRGHALLHCCAVQPPKIYENVPPAPAGLLWWHYAPGVPPLPNPEEYYQNSSWSSWGWRYNEKFQQVSLQLMQLAIGRSLPADRLPTAYCWCPARLLCAGATADVIR